MTVQFLLIGLGQIGASFGLALDEHKETITRIGYDTDPVTAKKAKKMGAVDSTVMWLQESISKADVILLAVPADQMGEMMETVLPGMQTGAVVLDTAPIKTQTAAWVGEFLPKGCSYVGLTPSINPDYLYEAEESIDAAHADLFEKGTMAIATLPETDAKAVKLATDLIQLVGSVPLFSDAAEIEGLMAAIHILPQLLGAAILDINIDRVGWPDAQRMAGRAFAGSTGAFSLLGEPKAITGMAKYSSESTLRALDETIAALENMREKIAAGNTDDLDARFEELRQGHDKWLLDRKDAKFGMAHEPLPKRALSKEFFGNLFGLTQRRKPGED
ncbi:MAG: prephenate dehydrogenase/arogenate dehydrogenase family protein [Chloroflexota bacterium]